MSRPMMPFLCMLIAVLVPAGASRAVEQARVDWLAEHAVPFATVEAGHGFADLEPLKEMIGDARVVGLGEGTHGTREHFQLKHRLVEYLATELQVMIPGLQFKGEPVSSGNAARAAVVVLREQLARVKELQGFFDQKRGEVEGNAQE